MHHTRILVVDDHDAVRRGICSILSTVPEFDIVCETSTGEEAVAKAQGYLPDIVLLDISLPRIGGLEAARSIRAVSPLSRILFMSQYDSKEMVQEAFSAGGTGYLLKSDAGRELLNAIRAVQVGTLYVSDKIVFSGQETLSGRGRSQI
jgi:DNA-binding NarL/FixJ family response regulator